MQKFSLTLLSLIFISVIFFFTSCKKDDSTAPVVNLIGSTHIMHILNQPYIDPGATATDDGDPIAAVIEYNDVEVNLVGEYKVIWIAVDAAGNKGSAERKITVYNEANNMIGNYNIHVKTDSSSVIYEYDYTDMILIAGNVNNQIWVNKFNNYQNAAVFMHVDTSSITVPNQTVGIPPNQRTFSGQGFIETSTGNFEIQVMEIVSGPPYYTKQSIVIYIKQ